MISEKQRLKELVVFVRISFSILMDKYPEQTFKRIAEASGLSLTTVYNLAGEKFTLRLQFRTVQALALTAGLQFSWTKQGKARIKLVA